MSRPAAKGWCPGAWRPMPSGDGLIVRVRPRISRIPAAALTGLCAAAERHGNGVLDLTSRANLQIRGVGDDRVEALAAELAGLGLLDPDAEAEARRNVVVAPLWRAGDETHRIALALTSRLGALPELPAKFGFAVDTGERRALAEASADVRIERGAGGGLIVRAGGAPAGRPTRQPVAAALEMARWFAEERGGVRPDCRTASERCVQPGEAAALEGGPGAASRRQGTDAPSRYGGTRRMRDLCHRLPPEWAVEPPAAAAHTEPGATALGPVVGVPFGQIDAAALAEAVARSGAAAVRLAPRRLLLLESGTEVPGPPFVTARGNPLLAADACPGAPACAAATVETRALARALARRVAGLHVSGCAKGCARARPARVTLVGREGRFDLVRDGAAWDSPARRSMTATEILAEADTF